MNKILNTMYDKHILGEDGSKTTQQREETTDARRPIFRPGQLFDFINFLILLHTDRIAQYGSVFAKTAAHHPAYGFSGTSIAEGKAMRQQLGRLLIAKGGFISQNAQNGHSIAALAEVPNGSPAHLLLACCETESTLVHYYEMGIYSDWPIDEESKTLFVQQHKLMVRSLKTVAYLQKQIGTNP